MDQQSPVMVVVADENDRLFAHQIANALGFSTADIVVGEPSEAVQMLRQRTAPPQYIIIDVGDRGAEVLADIDAMAEFCEPGTRVVVIGTVNDVNFYRELKSRGVIEYFPKPARIADIRSALMNVSAAASATRGTVISFMSAASGDGSSTVALNTAFCLAAEFRQPTVIVDMDFQYGMIAKNLDLASQYGIKELFEHPDRGIDSTLIDRMLVDYGQQLKLIASPNELRLLPTVRPEVIRDLILTLQERFKFVVIDLPHIWTTWVAAALSHSTKQVMVGQLWLRSVTHATRLLGAWNDVGIEKSNTSLVINRSGSKFKEAIDSKDFERVCGKKIDHHLGNDTRIAVEAENQGKTILEVGGTSPLARQLRDLTETFLPDTMRTHKPHTPGKLAKLGSLLGTR